MKDKLLISLLVSLNDSPSMQERELLDNFISSHNSKYTFPPPYSELVQKLFTCRLFFDEFTLTSEFYSYILKIFQTLRILTRDQNLIHGVISGNGLEIIGKLLKFYCNQHFEDFTAKYISEILVEISTIVRRLGDSEALIQQISKFEIPQVLGNMLGSSHAIVTRASLEALICIVKEESAKFNLENTSIVEMLLRIISEYDGEFIQLAANILNAICVNDEMSRQVRSLRGNVILLNQLKKSKDLSTTLYISRVIMTLCMETDNIKEFRALGLIGLLIKVIENSQDPLEVINALRILIDMTLDDDTSVYIRQHGAFAIISLIVQYHPSQYPEDYPEEIKPGLYEIQLNALQCIRFIYSIERNRKYFRKVFSPQIFSNFIDIGNYIKEISAYQPTLKLINTLGQAETESLKEGFLVLKESNETHPTREIAGYLVGEVLGKGAFGTVYEATKGINRYALKEIHLNELESDLEDDSIEQVIEMMNKEVSIYKSLNHPNIIKYYTSFVENQTLYIVMELIEGQTLADYISSLKEKNQRIDEGKIWRFAIEMCAGLNYLHVEKKVVHRDFTPMNLMITKDSHHVKIADFGLAKQRGTQSSSSMKTFVGTIQYSCPEIVRNQPYTEKADIWSLGVILYELATLNTPFSGENPLAIARKIVEEDYEKLKPQEFSALFINFVQSCMTVQPEKRPDILRASQMIAPLLLKKIEDYRKKEDEIMKITKKEPQAPVKVQVKPTNFKKISDPTIPIFHTMHKLVYLTQLPPGLKKDVRRSMVEGFKHWLFSDPKNADRVKFELVKLNNCEKEEAPMTRGEKVTYETLNFAMEELLIELGYYEKRDTMTSEMFFQKN